jgi:hypothetical protein
MSGMKIGDRTFAFAARAASRAFGRVVNSLQSQYSEMQRVGGVAFLAVAASMLAIAAGAAAQTGSTGAIRFDVRATPASGVQEPVRGFPIYLLNKSFGEIWKEAAAAYPAPDMDAFIDKLDISKELKAWMTKNQCVQLSGEKFLAKVKPADVITVPEFYSAYLQRSQGSASLDFPKAKYKPVDKTKDPAKYARLSTEYHEAVERYIEANPQSKDGMDLDLADLDPSEQWQVLTAKREPEIRRRATELAESKYLVARTQTDLEGQGSVSRVPPGAYWLSSMDLSAQVGDVRPRWDVPVTVRAGQTAYVELSDVNAVQAPGSAP